MKIGTAFSGGFGSVEFALKYLNQDHQIIFACEWKDPQRKSYINNHGNPPIFYKDIRNMDSKSHKGEIDYYHLSPPCQSYSLAGSRGGAADERGGLMFEAIKSIDEVQPKMFSVENVKGLISSNNGEDWKNILKDFRSLKGYTISWGIINAKEQGTPQNRERVFIVGFRGQAPQMSFPKRIELDKNIGSILEDHVPEKYYLSQKMIDGFTINNKSDFKFEPHNIDDAFSKCLTARYFKMGKTDPYIKVPQLIQVGNIDQKGHNSLWGRVYSTEGIGACLNANGGGAGAKTGLYQIPSGHKKGFVEVGYGDTINLAFVRNSNSRGTARNDGIANTLDTSCNQAVIQDRIRKLTPRECARLQGDFNDQFNIKGFSDTKLYEFIGNAMDISSTKNLITRMLEHCKNVKFTKPIEPSFASTNIIQKGLF